MSNTELNTPADSSICPKRLWVMLTLSDDELTSGDEPLPLGLASHLAHCESCRALAEQIQAVTGAIEGLAGLEPLEDLQRRAEEQALAALKSGAVLTGRVEVPDLEEPRVVESPGAAVRLFWPKAAAAVILFAVGLFWASQRVGPGEPAELPASAQSADVWFDPSADGVDPLSDDVYPWEVETVVDESSSEDEFVADSEHNVGPVLPPRTICRHHSHVEAAMSEGTCIHRAVILPDPNERTLGLGGEFDTPAPVDSTEGLLEQN